MKSQERNSGAEHAFRLVPHARGKTLVGVAAVVAAGSFAFLVFGPLADQRSLAMAGPFEVPAAVGAAAATARSEPVLPELWAGAVPGQFNEAY